MSYIQGGTVQAVDFNTFAGNSTSTNANVLNTVFGPGIGSSGYGQTPMYNITSGSTLLSADWTHLTSNIANVAAHQGTSLLPTNPVTPGSVDSYSANLANNLSTLYTNKLNASSQGNVVQDIVTNQLSWSNNLVFTHVVTFASGDAARYFFNSGGQLQISLNHPTATGANMDLLYTGLASNVGNIYISSPVTSNCIISGITFNGVSKIGGGGNSPTINSTKGYYGLSSSNTTVFTQTATTGPSTELNSNVQIILKTNGTQGTNGDNGSIITLYTVWSENPSGLVVSPGSSTTVSIISPETSYLTKSWGNITITGNVVAS